MTSNTMKNLKSKMKKVSQEGYDAKVEILHLEKKICNDIETVLYPNDCAAVLRDLKKNERIKNSTSAEYKEMHVLKLKLEKEIDQARAEGRITQ